MKTKKRIALFLSLLLALSLILPTSAAFAEGEQENKGMEISKTATANDDGTYTITLEAYATGEKVISEVKKDVPTDIVLVLDQSGSMTEDMNTYGFRAYSGKTNSDFYDLRHNGASNRNLYYKLADGSYATVSVTITLGGIEPSKCPSDWQNDKSLSWNDRDPDDYWKYSNNLYVKVGEEYKKVTLEREWISEGILRGYNKYTYTFPDGTTFTSERDGTSPGDFGGKGPLYYLTTTTGEYTYTYTYTDKDGKTQTIGQSTGASTRPTEFTLYERYQTGTTIRLAALKSAVTTFANSIKTKAAGADGLLGTEDDVDHRIAVVGFACSNTGNNDNYNNYQNTEVFIGSTQYKYGTAAQGQYKNALQSMKTTQGQNNVTASIGALAADGATYVNHGIEMANGILKANPVPEGEKRNRVVVVFTDGVPGYSGFESDVANAAITQANTTRSLGANVYAVGIFDGADATSAGNENGTENQKANWFMQKLSDNKGTPQTPSYYLSAADADTLNNIFQQIADNIETGGSATTLDENTVIKDIISPQFTLPEGATITLETYSYTGENQWKKNENAMGATAVVNGDQVSVTGFDFSENWCGTETNNGNTTYRGNKLVISFKVNVKGGFLGGNNVYTNTSAGVYENSNAEKPVFEFVRPQVNVPIGEVTVTPAEKNVYLLGNLTAEQLKSGATATVGGVTLDLSTDAENYGLQPWQNEYVDITVEIKDKNGNAVTDLTNLADDQTYSITVTVAPKTGGTGAVGNPATAKTDTGNDNINVFKPKLTFKDSDVYYGADVPTDFSGNKVDPDVWKNGETTSDGVTMIGDVPPLSIAYTPDPTKITNEKVNTKQDIPVKVEVKIGNTDVSQYVTFAHQACVPACGWNETVLNGDPAFLLHVKTCQLTITKQGGANDEPYVFTVKKDGTVYSEVTIVGNGSETIYELPVGTYTIEENTGWSWRYSPTYGNDVTLSAANTEGTIICTNNKNKDLWLNGYSGVVPNVYGVPKQ